MEELLLKLRKKYGKEMAENPDRPFEETQLRGQVIRAARVLIMGRIVDLLQQNDLMSVWVDRAGSRKETTVQDVFDYIAIQLS